MLDTPCLGSYNPTHSEVVSEKYLIEKDVLGESIRGKLSLKSFDVFAEEILVKVERHGFARYSLR